jgi:hypothetical protein
MRRSRWAVAAVCALFVGLAAGCGNPGGVDGELGDDWVGLAEPKAFTPAAQACHRTSHTEFGSLATYRPVDCAGAHRSETFHVGTFAGAEAGRNAPPPRASQGMRTAYAACDKQARGFLGDDWRQGRLWLGVVVPSASGWAGGARWFRCDLYEVSDVDDFGDSVDRQGSLKGALGAASPLRLGCYQVKSDSDGVIDSMSDVACTKQHNSEFVGVYQAPASMAYPKGDSAWKRLHTGCRKAVASYVKVPDDANLVFRTGTVAVPNLEDDWKNGNHGVRCYLYLNDAKLTKSMKGVGAKGLPIR